MRYEHGVSSMPEIRLCEMRSTKDYRWTELLIRYVTTEQTKRGTIRNIVEPVVDELLDEATKRGDN